MPPKMGRHTHPMKAEAIVAPGAPEGDHKGSPINCAFFSGPETGIALEVIGAVGQGGVEGAHGLYAVAVAWAVAVAVA